MHRFFLDMSTRVRSCVLLTAALLLAGSLPASGQSLPAPELSDVNAGVACPSDILEWTSVTGATSYQIWYRHLQPTPDPTYFKIYDGTALSLTITVPQGFTREYVAAACNAQGCSGFSNGVPVSEGNCP